MAAIRSTIQKRDAKGVVRHGAEWLALWADPNSMKTASEKREDRLSRLRLDRIRRDLIASARSVAGRPDLEVLFGEGAAGPGVLVLRPLDSEPSNLAARRGECDAAASILRHHDARVHAGSGPATGDARMLFDLLEDVRCEALGALNLPGMRGNLVAAQHDRLARADLLNAHLASLVPLEEALRMVARDMFLGEDEASIQTAGLRMWDRWLRERFTPPISEMSAVLERQFAFATYSEAFIGLLLTELPSLGRVERRLSPTAILSRQDPQDEDTIAAQTARESEGGDVLKPDAEGTLALAPSLLHAGPAQAPPKPYAPFTQRHDRIAAAEDLADRRALRDARRSLEDKRAGYRRALGKLVAKLQRRLMSQQLRAWEFDLEEGLVDAARLDRVIVNPGFAHAFKNETNSAFPNTLVTILIDNSGSMRGQPIEIACLTADMLTTAMERCSVASEILGFTTSAWKGGQSAQDWARAGRPDAPGRLNDLLHIVYKSAETPMRRARDALPAMLDPGLLKENIDGEALLWAAQRMLRRPEHRRILVVISDGAPVDQATLEANDDKRILDRHLRETIRWIETETPIELLAIGVRHDVAGYYRTATRIDRAEDLGATAVAHLDRLFHEGGKQQAR